MTAKSPSIQQSTDPQAWTVRRRPTAFMTAALALTIAGWACAPLEAATLSGVLGARMTITSGCVISGGTGAQSGVGFGTLDFGSRPATFIGTAAATATGGDGGAGTTQIVCSTDITAFSLTVDGGTHSGQGSAVGTGSRAMSNGSGGFIPYEVFQDAGHTSPYTAGATVTGISVPTAGNPFALPIYGLVNKTNAAAVASGTYTDQLQVTLTF